MAAEIDGQLDVVAERARGRVDGLLGLPRMAWAVSTDADTVRDLTLAELTLTPREGETIEIAQWSIAESKSTRLLRQPAESPIPVIPIEQRGEHFLASPEGVFVAVVRALDAKQRADQVSGLIGVAERWDSAAVEKHLASLGARLRIEGLNGHAVWGAPAAAANEATVIVPLGTAAAPGSRLIFSFRGVGPPRRGLFLVLGIVLVLAAVIGFWLSERGGAAAARPPAGASESELPVATEFDEAPISVTAVNAVPPRANSEIAVSDSPASRAVAAVAAAAMPARPAGSRTSSSSLRPLVLDPARAEVPMEHIGSERVIVGSNGDHHGQPALTGEEWGPTNPHVVATLRRLYDEYLALRRTCGERTDDIDYERFAATLRRRRRELIERHLFKEVTFRIAFNDGKAIVRSTGIR